MKTRYYDVNGFKFKVEPTGIARVNLTVKDTHSDQEFIYVFGDIKKAMDEMLSYAEIDEDDF